MSQRWLNHVHPNHRNLLTTVIELIVRHGQNPDTVLRQPWPNAQDDGATQSTVLQELQEMGGAINVTGKLVDAESMQPIAFKQMDLGVLKKDAQIDFPPVGGMLLDTIYYVTAGEDGGVSFATNSGSGYIIGGVEGTVGDPLTFPQDQTNVGSGATSPKLPIKSGQVYSMRLLIGQETFQAHVSMESPPQAAKKDLKFK